MGEPDAEADGLAPPVAVAEPESAAEGVPAADALAEGEGLGVVPEALLVGLLDGDVRDEGEPDCEGVADAERLSELVRTAVALLLDVAVAVTDAWLERLAVDDRESVAEPEAE